MAASRFSEADIRRWDSAAWAAYMRPRPVFPAAAIWGCTTMAQKYGGTFAVSASASALRKARTR